MFFARGVTSLLKQTESHGVMNLLDLPQIYLRKKGLYLGFMKKSAVLVYLKILFALDIKSNFLMRVSSLRCGSYQPAVNDKSKSYKQAEFK